MSNFSEIPPGYGQQPPPPGYGQQPPPGNPHGRRRRAPWIWGSVAGLVVIVLVAVIGIRFLGATESVASDSTSDSTEVSSDGYQWADPQLDLPRDHAFTFDIDYDPVAKASELGMDEREFEDYAFSVYTEPGLNRRAGFNPKFSEGTVAVQGYDAAEGVAALNDKARSDGTAAARVKIRGGASQGEWGLHDEYYLVQRLDAQGKELSEPIVTRFTVQHELPAPQVRYTADEAGNLDISWQPVEGAAHYLVIKSDIQPGPAYATTRRVTVVGQTEELSWSAEESVSWLDEKTRKASGQNVGLNLFTAPAESVEKNSELAAYQGSEYEYGVIATDGSNYSPYVSHDAVEIAADLPAQLPSAAQLFDVENIGAIFADLSRAPTSMRYVALDGTLRAAVVQLDPTTIVEKSGTYVTVAHAGKSPLGVSAVFGTDGTDPRAAVEEFNARALKAAPPTGLVDPKETDDADEIAPVPTPSADDTETASPAPKPAPADVGPEDDYIPPGAPDLGYPVYGSNDYVRYIAANMIARVVDIDVSSYAQLPGAQSVQDAVDEAMSQNHYIIGAYNYRAATVGNQTYVRINYVDSPDRVVEIQEKVEAKVEKVVGDIIDDSMSDAKKIAAINDYLVKNAEYDNEALAAFGAGGDMSKYWYTQDVYGILLDGLGVCASYSRSFDILADAVGLDSVYVTGDVYEGGPHAWNKVKVDGRWRAVDVTWNDSPAGNDFLMIDDEEFTGEAARQESSHWMNDRLLSGYATS